MRTTLVAAALVVSLGLTSVLLMVLAPAPLAPSATSLVAPIEVPLPLHTIYETRKPLAPGRWKSILVQQSKTRRGDLIYLSQLGVHTHFVIGNGDGCGNGEIQFGQRWHEQQPAVMGSTSRGSQIVICLVGDFDQTKPTEAQLQRLRELLRSLQDQLKIPIDQGQPPPRSR